MNSYEFKCIHKEAISSSMDLSKESKYSLQHIPFPPTPQRAYVTQTMTQNTQSSAESDREMFFSLLCSHQ